MKTTYVLSQTEIEKSLEFAERIIDRNSQSDLDFGSRIIRSQTDAIADTAEGKLAEFALARFLEAQFMVSFDPDFDIYDSQYITDNGHDLDRLTVNDKPLTVSQFKVDIKATRQYSRWLLVEEHKYKRFASNAYVLVKTELPRHLESNHKVLSRLNNVKCKICGFAARGDLMRTGDGDDIDPWFDFQAGSRLFKYGFRPLTPIDRKRQCTEQLAALNQSREIKFIGKKLKAVRNFGLPIEWLRNTAREWELLIERVLMMSK